MKENKRDPARLRKDYIKKILEIEDVLPNPIHQFGQWFKEAIEAEILEPNAMTLASCSLEGKPSARIVLLKGFDESGFVFFTNYNSRKGMELVAHPFAALVFCWLAIERQVRIEGKVEKLSYVESTAYFQSRPKGSQIGAWASPQSEVIPDKSILEKKVIELEEIYKDEQKLPCPQHWGGFVVIPNRIEFWQGRPSRLHDRIQYSLNEGKTWKIERLAP